MLNRITEQSFCQTRVELTRSLNNMLELFGVVLLDHIIVTDSEQYYSFSDNNIL